MTTPPHELITTHMLDNLDLPITSLESHLDTLGSTINILSAARRVPPSLRLGVTNATSDLSNWEHSIQLLTANVTDLRQQDALGAATELDGRGVEPIDRSTVRKAILHSRQDNIIPSAPSAHDSTPLSTKDKLLPLSWTLNNGAIFTYNELKALLRTGSRSGVRVRCWSPVRSKSSPAKPAALHILVDKIIQAFIVLNYPSEGDNSGITVDRVTCFAPHEAKPPSGNSTYNAYQCITRYFSVLLSAQPDLTPRNILDILLTYRTLFRDKCSLCGTELSADGRMPPVGRIWKNREGNIEENTDAGTWMPRHVQCMSAFY